MMVSNSKSTDSSKSRNMWGEQVSGDLGVLTSKINLLKKQIEAERVVLIREKVEKNKEKLRRDVCELVSLGMGRNTSEEEKNKMLCSRIKNPVCLLTGSSDDNQEVAISISAKLPPVDKIPPYTSWIFLDRNQRMGDDQSVVGRRRIYYDQNGSEALICSDSEEETTEPEEDKHEFSEAENRIMRTICKDFDPNEDVLEILTQHIGGNTSEIYEAYMMMKTEVEEEEEEEEVEKVKGDSTDHKNVSLDKSLSASLDSLDNLFCRRCLVFDCRLHGYSQTVITPAERQYCPLESQEDAKPCSDHCYLQFESGKKHSDVLSERSNTGADDPGKRKQTSTELEESKDVTEDEQESSLKKQKMLSIPDEKSVEVDGTSGTRGDEISSNSNDEENSCCGCGSVSGEKSRGVDLLKHESESCEWKPLEKDLYVKGLEIFGRNSCLISRNLLCGLKSCIQVANYMYDNGSGSGAETSWSMLNGNGRADANPKEQETGASRARLVRRKGRAKKVKYSWKSGGHPSLMWRRIADGKNASCKQYIPCGCKSMCGKECPCLDNATCCEKYCGCSKSCKNRFRGCHCAKSQCRSRQCPCFAAGRECDPDVCRNCWVSCGDGSVGEPPKRGEGHCANMRLLLRQQQRILLGRSNVAGWGAFLKNSVNRNDYLGEYTGELISHREADKRGKIYDRANSSFLFDLNDQYVLDAYRKGDKLKFANHSSNPNCYAKVMMVAGDHRVGIFARERIEAGEELFYDYRYGPDQAPAWARKPDASKPDDLLLPQARAKKH